MAMKSRIIPKALCPNPAPKSYTNGQINSEETFLSCLSCWCFGFEVVKGLLMVSPISRVRVGLSIPLPFRCLIWLRVISLLFLVALDGVGYLRGSGLLLFVAGGLRLVLLKAWLSGARPVGVAGGFHLFITIKTYKVMSKKVRANPYHYQNLDYNMGKLGKKDNRNRDNFLCIYDTKWLFNRAIKCLVLSYLFWVSNYETDHIDKGNLNRNPRIIDHDDEHVLETVFWFGVAYKYVNYIDSEYFINNSHKTTQIPTGAGCVLKLVLLISGFEGSGLMDPLKGKGIKSYADVVMSDSTKMNIEVIANEYQTKEVSKTNSCTNAPLTNTKCGQSSTKASPEKLVTKPNIKGPNFDPKNLFNKLAKAREDGKKKKELTLVGFLVGDQAEFPRLFAKLRQEWRVVKGTINFAPLKAGWFEISFSNQMDFNKIWVGRPYHVFSQLLLLRKWHTKFDPTIEPIYQLDLWVRLFFLPEEFANPAALRDILEENNLGSFIKMDPFHNNNRYNMFTRFCINTNVADNLRRKVLIPDENMELVKYKMWFDDFPDGCGACGSRGHDFEECEQRINQTPTLNIKVPKPILINEEGGGAMGTSANMAEWKVAGKNNKLVNNNKSNNGGKTKPYLQSSKGINITYASDESDEAVAPAESEIKISAKDGVFGFSNHIPKEARTNCPVELTIEDNPNKWAEADEHKFFSESQAETLKALGLNGDYGEGTIPKEDSEVLEFLNKQGNPDQEGFPMAEPASYFLVNNNNNEEQRNEGDTQGEDLVEDWCDDDQDDYLLEEEEDRNEMEEVCGNEAIELEDESEKEQEEDDQNSKTQVYSPIRAIPDPLFTDEEVDNFARKHNLKIKVRIEGSDPSQPQSDLSSTSFIRKLNGLEVNNEETSASHSSKRKNMETVDDTASSQNQGNKKPKP